MGAPSAREIAEKAAGDLTPANLESSGGYLPVEKADEFIDLMADQPTILKDVDVIKMNGPVRELDLAGFSSRILHTSTTGTEFDEAKRSKLDTAKVTLISKPFRAVVYLGYDTVEDCIAQGNLRPYVQEKMIERASLDMEEIVVLADITSGDEDLATMDGIVKSCTTNVINNSGDPQDITKAVFYAGLRGLPNRYKRDKANTRYYVSPTVSEKYRDYLAERNTVGGDAHLMGQPGGLNYQGYSIYDVSWMPNEKYILTHRMNITVGIQRKMLFEVEKKATQEQWAFILSMRFDVKYKEVAGAVLYNGLNVPVNPTE